MKVKINQKIIISVLVAALGLFIFPILFATLYGLPAADDFINTIQFINHEGSFWTVIIDNAKLIYMNWQGTYFGNFIAQIPIFYLLGVSGLRLMMFFSAVFLFFSMFFCLKTFADKLGVFQSEKILFVLTVFFLFVFYPLNFCNFDEIFFWYTCVCVYTIPLAVCFLAVVSYLKYSEGKKMLWLLSGIIFGFLGAGGALNISAFLCTVLLFLICYDFIIGKKLHLSAFIGLFALLGSILNVVAPGNFVRHDVINSNYNIFSAVFYSFYTVTYEIIKGIEAGVLPTVIVLVFILSYRNLKESKIEFKYPVLITVFGYLSCVISVFPVIFGYNGTGLAGRTVFVELIVIIFYTMLVTVYWAGWLCKKNISLLNKDFFKGLCVIFIIPAAFYVLNPGKLLPLKMICHELKGDYGKKSERELGILETIKNSQEEDVVIVLKDDDIWANTKSLGLSDNRNDAVNDAVAKYFNKKSVSLKIE